jgi:hypothetical protein
VSIVRTDTCSVAQLKKLCGSPDPGYIWKLDDEPPSGPWLRGIIAELDLKYHEYRLWTHLPTAEGVDFVKDAAAVQVKTTRSNSASTVNRMKGVIDDLIREGRSRGCSDFRLDIRRKPGLDTVAMKASLDAYIQSLRDVGTLSPGDAGSALIQDYEFIPKE